MTPRCSGYLCRSTHQLHVRPLLTSFLRLLSLWKATRQSIVDVMGDTASLDVGCLTGGLDHNTGREDPLAILRTHKSASPSFSAPPENSPTRVSTEFIGSAVCDFLEGGDNLNLQQLWPPPRYAIRCTYMIRVLQLVGCIQWRRQGGTSRCPGPP
jgi:hypothetical protein